IYFHETAQRSLQERLSDVSAQQPDELRAKLEAIVLSATLRKERMHAFWTLVGSGALDPAFHLKVLAHADPAYRAWGVRAAGNYGNVSPAVREKVIELACDPSPDVQIQAAIASRKIENFNARSVLNYVLSH